VLFADSGAIPVASVLAPRNLVLFADSGAIPVASVLAYRKYAPRARHRARLLSAKITRFLDWEWRLGGFSRRG
jgi:hypothetical protein